MIIALGILENSCEKFMDDQIFHKGLNFIKI